MSAGVLDTGTLEGASMTEVKRRLTDLIDYIISAKQQAESMDEWEKLHDLQFALEMELRRLSA